MPRWCRYVHDGDIGLGQLSGDMARPVVQPFKGDLFGAPLMLDVDPLPLDRVRLLPPCEPRSFVGLWNNSRALAEKMSWAIPAAPLYFFKATSSVAGPADVIRAPASYEGKVFYEGELGVVIGRRCSRATPAQAGEAIFGYTCINDVTAFDLIGADASFAQWARAKSFDTFGVIGPWIETGLDASRATVVTRVNGRERQNYPVGDLVFGPAELVHRLSHDMTLQPGDVIACGTSLGALPMKPGHVIEVEVSGVGVLRNPYATDTAVEQT